MSKNVNISITYVLRLLFFKLSSLGNYIMSPQRMKGTSVYHVAYIKKAFAKCFGLIF